MERAERQYINKKKTVSVTVDNQQAVAERGHAESRPTERNTIK